MRVHSSLVHVSDILLSCNWYLTGGAYSLIQLLVDGDPTEVEDIDLLILVSQWAGIANVQQVPIQTT